MAKRIVFMGTPSFSVPILQALADQYQILGVVTQPDRPVGRKRQLAASPVKQAAEKLGLPVLQPEKLTQSSAMNQIIAWQPDFIITAAMGSFYQKNYFKLLVSEPSMSTALCCQNTVGEPRFNMRYLMVMLRRGLRLCTW